MPHEHGRDHARQQTTGHKIDNEARLAKRGSFLLNNSPHISTLLLLYPLLQKPCRNDTNRSNLLSNPSANFPTQTALISFACWGLFISVCLRVASGMSTKNHAKHMFTYRLKLNTLAGLLHWLWWGKGLNGYIQNCNHKTQHQLYHPLFLSFFYPLKLHLYFSFLSFPQTPWKPLTPRCCPRWMSFLTKQRQGPNLACRNLQ